MHKDLPLLLRIWFVLFGSILVASAWWPRGRWYFKRTTTPVPNWLHWSFSIGGGLVFIFMGLFGHISN